MASATFTASAQRFLFETSFDPEEMERRAREARRVTQVASAPADPEPEPPPAPTFSEAELDAARREAFAAGFEAGGTEAMASVERDTAASLQAALEQAGKLIEAQRSSDAELAGRTIDMALALVRKMLPALMQRDGAGEIEAVVRDCLADMLEEPRIVIRMNDAVLDTMRPRLTETARALGYQGAIVMLADAALGAGDVKVEWADGGAERLSDRLWTAIEEAASRLTGTAAATAPSQPKRRRRKPAADATSTNAD